jgi:hypothetical protein
MTPEAPAPAAQPPEPPAPPDAASLRLFYHPAGTPRLTIVGERTYLEVKLYLAWPLSDPARYVSLQDARGEEIAMVETLDQLDAASRAVAEEELRRRYLTASIRRIYSIRTEFGVTYWHVDTHRGERDFVVQSVSESCGWLSDRHLLITDVDGNRFEIEDLEALDPRSRAWLDGVL